MSAAVAAPAAMAAPARMASEALRRFRGVPTAKEMGVPGVARRLPRLHVALAHERVRAPRRGVAASIACRRRAICLHRIPVACSRPAVEARPAITLLRPASSLRKVGRRVVIGQLKRPRIPRSGTFIATAITLPRLIPAISRHPHDSERLSSLLRRIHRPLGHKRSNCGKNR
jgi:hypothetical protein